MRTTDSGCCAFYSRPPALSGAHGPLGSQARRGGSGLALGALLCIAGCGSGSAPTYSVRFDALTVPPGRESTQCVIKRLPNPSALHVSQIRSTLGPGTHHVILYTSSETEERPTPFDCKPFSNLLNAQKGVPLLIAQSADEALQLPPGVGIPLAPQQMVRIEMHYINASTAPIQISATATFTEMPPGELRDEAGFAFFSNSAIDLPPASTRSLGPLFLPVPTELVGVKFFGFTGHQHKLGTGVRVTSAAAPDAPDSPVYDPPRYVWSEPPTVYHDPPVQLPAGGGFRLTCGWQNPTSSPVTFGESANDEMCVFWSHYYPNKGFVSCAYTDKLMGGVTFCCPGDPVCSLVL